MTDLQVEVQDQADGTVRVGGALMMTPPLGEGYWEYRVMLGDRQAVVGFPKFSTIGGDDAISDEDCIAAIRMIQEAARADREVQS